MERWLESAEGTRISRQNLPICDPSMSPPEAHDESDSDDQARLFPVFQRFSGSQSICMPGEMTRDFCMRERTYMSWSKFTALVTVLSVIFFLDLRIFNIDNYAHQVSMSLACIQNGHLRMKPFHEQQVLGQRSGSPGYDMSQFETKAMLNNEEPDPIPRRIQAMVLGSIYLIVGILSWVISVFDYFERIGELERERTLMDECEGHTHPIVTILSMVICVIVLATIVFLVVQHGA